MAQSSKYVALFVAESREHLQQCNAQLLAWERDLAQDAPISELFRNETDVRQLIKLKAVYELLESATDKCQDVANVIESVVLENA